MLNIELAHDPAVLLLKIYTPDYWKHILKQVHECEL